MTRASHLVVLRLSAMGDVALMVPLLRVLFATYPSLEITLVSRPAFKPVFAEFKRLNFFAVDLNERHKGLMGLWRLFRDLNELNPESVADLHSVLRTHVLVTFFRLSGLKVRRIDKGRREKKGLTREKNKVFKPLKTTLNRYADVFEALGFKADLTKAATLFPSTKDLSPTVFDPSSFPGEKLPEKDRPWVGVAPFASFPGKTYPMDLMKEAVALLGKDYHVLLFAAPGDEATEVETWPPLSERTYAATRLGSFANELSLISQLDLMISMDSANGHLAANYGVPVLTIWGLTHPYAGFAPFGQSESNNLLADRSEFPLIPTSIYGNVVPEGYDKAMRSISPQDIANKVRELLTDN